MKRLILARLLPALLIAGCVGGSATRDVLQGAMTISGPSGYCVDPSASREGDDRAIILMGRCSASTAVKPAVVTLSVGPAGSAGVMIAGGAEAAITPLGVAGFAASKALSFRNDEPTKASRPFDKDRDGFVLGEGAGAREDLLRVVRPDRLAGCQGKTLALADGIG